MNSWNNYELIKLYQEDLLRQAELERLARTANEQRESRESNPLTEKQPPPRTLAQVLHLAGNVR
jgi:hypothetical protein